MRRGSFFASELIPVSILFFSIFVPVLHSQAAIFLHSPEVNSDEQERHKWENHHVQHVETQERVFTDDVAAKHQKPDVAAHHGHGGNNVGANGHGPEGELVPGQEIARVTEEQRDKKEHDANNPVELVGRLVTPAVEHVKHVPEDGEDHQMRGQPVKIPKKDSVGNDELQVLHIPVGMRRSRMVIEHQQNAGDEKNDEKDE